MNEQQYIEYSIGDLIFCCNVACNTKSLSICASTTSIASNHNGKNNCQNIKNIDNMSNVNENHVENLSIAEIIKVECNHEWTLLTVRHIDEPDTIQIIKDCHVCRKVPIKETDHMHRWAQPHPMYIPEISGYAKKIAYQCTKTLQFSQCNNNGFDEKQIGNFGISKLYKEIEYKNKLWSPYGMFQFDYQSYFTFYKLFERLNPKHILSLTIGDPCLLLEMFLDFKKFPRLNSISVMDLDSLRFAQFEKQFDLLCQIIDNNQQNSDASLQWSTLLWSTNNNNDCNKCDLHNQCEYRHSVFFNSAYSNVNIPNHNGHLNCNNSEWYHKKFYANMIRDYAIPIKMIIKHKATNRTLIIYRQHPFDIIPINSKNKKYDLLLNWIFLPYCQLKQLYSNTNLLLNKFSNNKRIIVTTQDIHTKLCNKININLAKELKVQSINEYVKIYTNHEPANATPAKKQHVN